MEKNKFAKKKKKNEKMTHLTACKSFLNIHKTQVQLFLLINNFYEVLTNQFKMWEKRSQVFDK